MFKILSVMLFFSFPIKLFGQISVLTGKVVNTETNDVMSAVNISVFNKSGVIFHTITDSSGTFNIPFKLLSEIDHIKISLFNFDVIIIKNISQKLKDNQSLGTFKMSPHIIELKEVKIKSNKRYRDTTKIDLSGQKFERSIMIDDIFSTNGFSKNTDGQLYYKGKPVSDILVNGGDFFGKNNKEVYSLLPALVLDKIDVIETNIDSTTNTTTLKSQIKINLKFKEQYKKGKFGNASAGQGTEKRYLAGVGLYTYKNIEQASLTLNSNNINIREIPLSEPSISFSANGNNVRANNAKLTYNNVVAKKLEIDASVKGRLETREFISESERQDQAIDQYSKTTNKSNSKLHGITNARVRLNYKIDSLNTLQITQTNDYTNGDIADSINYLIKTDSSVVISNLSRRQKVINSSSATDIVYKKLFASKKGRSFNFILNHADILNKNNELDNVYNISNTVLKTYYIDGKRKANTTVYTLHTDFTEPINDDSYVNVFSSYKNDRVNYASDFTSDSLINFLNIPVEISNRLIQSGAQYHKTFNRVSLDGSATALYNTRNSLVNSEMNNKTFFNINTDLKAEYKLNKVQDLTFLYNTTTNYPELSQLINFNNSYDLISQTSNNVNLKPEVKNSFKVLFNSRKESAGGYNINGGFDYYRSKITTNINTDPGAPQNIFYDNIGHAISATVGFSFYKNATEAFNFNYNNSLSYQQQPIIINKKINLNSGITFNQVISTTKEIFKNTLYISPVITTAYTKFYYESSTVKVITLSYSDKISLSVAQFKLDIYPLFSYSHSINSLTSLSMNAGLKRTVFGNGTIWLQGYDIFNSFRFNNNIINAAYTQTVKYSNISRYFVIGMSFKFNNIK